MTPLCPEKGKKMASVLTRLWGTKQPEFATTAREERDAVNGFSDEENFVLKVVQPALVGLMDGSVSTLAPIFAAAFATGSSHVAFLIGLSAAVGAAISMGFAEGLSDDGVLTGRGHPIMRGVITGAATFIGGVLHTLPFLLPHLTAALYLAYLIVGIELLAIAAIRYRYFKMNFFLSVVQVIFGGALVLVAGILIGHG
jgi:VIT1/CCC1 family predicted Fe2+/Mn2+ transporter